MTRQDLNIGVIGFGTVGVGVVKVLLENSETLQNNIGRKLVLKKVADLDITTDRGVPLADGILTTDAMAVINDPEIDVVAELIGGVKPAKLFIETALKNKKHVVTSNKEIIAKHGQEFIALAKANGVNIYFEAAVGGGIPIVRPLMKCLAANNIKRIYGILNGTTNYILTKMYQDKSAFTAALEEAQSLGYAEADPSNDIEGYDVRYKLAILAGIAFNSNFDYQEIYCEGITKISADDIEIAKEFGYVIKLLATGIAHDNNTVELRVHPVMVEQKHPLAMVNYSFNAVYVEGDMVGETMFYGHGAGALPTASAVVGDIIDIALHDTGATNGALNYNVSSKQLVSIDNVFSKYFVRIKVADTPGVWAAISAAFERNGVSIRSVQQKASLGVETELVLITHKVKNAAIAAALSDIKSLPSVEQVVSVIRAGV